MYHKKYFRFDQSNYSSRIVFSLLNLVKLESVPFDPLTPKTPLQNQTRSKSDDPTRRYRHLNFSRWRLGRHLGFSETGNSVVRSADLENPTTEPNMKWIGQPLCDSWSVGLFDVSCFMNSCSDFLYTFCVYSRKLVHVQ